MAKKKKGYRELKKYRVANGDTNEFVVDFKNINTLKESSVGIS